MGPIQIDSLIGPLFWVACAVYCSLYCHPVPLDPLVPELCESAPGQAVCGNCASWFIDSSSFSLGRLRPALPARQCDRPALHIDILGTQFAPAFGWLQRPVRADRVVSATAASRPPATRAPRWPVATPCCCSIRTGRCRTGPAPGGTLSGAAAAGAAGVARVGEQGRG